MTQEALAKAFAEARRMAAEGLGWEDLAVKCGLTETQARLIVSVVAKPVKVAR